MAEESPQVPEKTPLNLREFYHQPDLPLSKDLIIDIFHDLSESVTLKTHNAGPALYSALGAIREYCEVSFEKKTHPLEETPDPETSFQAGLEPAAKAQEARELREKTVEAYRQEIRQGIGLPLAVRNFFTTQPGAAIDNFLDQFFHEENDRLTPQQDLTNEQILFCLSLGFEHLVDHQLTIAAQEKYQDNPSGLAHDFYGFQLQDPQEAEAVFCPDRGVMFILSDRDYQRAYSQHTKSQIKANSTAAFLHFGALNSLLMIGCAGANQSATIRAENLSHEKDHLEFYKISQACELAQSLVRPAQVSSQPISARADLAAHINQNYQTMDHKISIAMELSAWQQAEDIFSANRSVNLEAKVPSDYPLTSSKDFFAPLQEYNHLLGKVTYPYLRQLLFERFYHASDLLNQAAEHGVAPERLSVALAILGLDRVRHLKALDPQLEVSGYESAFPYPNDAFANKEPPYLYEYLVRYDRRYQRSQANLDFEKWCQKTYDQARLYLGFTKHNFLSAIQERVPSSKYWQRFHGRELTGQEEIKGFQLRDVAVSTFRLFYPELSAKFFQQAWQAESPLNPVFAKEPKKFPFQNAPHFAAAVKRIALGGRRYLKEETDKMLALRDQPGFPPSFPVAAFWTEAFPVLSAASRFPKDRPLLNQFCHQLLPRLRKLPGLVGEDQNLHAVYLDWQGKQLTGPNIYTVYYLGFFHDYEAIRQSKMPTKQKQTALQNLYQQLDQRISQHEK